MVERSFGLLTMTQMEAGLRQLVKKFFLTQVVLLAILLLHLNNLWHLQQTHL
jgi:hypothetical protein